MPIGNPKGLSSGKIMGATNLPSTSSTAMITPGHSRSGFREVDWLL
jgi:hypothetical protein